MPEGFTSQVVAARAPVSKQVPAGVPVDVTIRRGR